MLDPRYGNVHLDANALEPPDPADKPLVSQFQELVHAQVLSVINPHGVQKEIDHPRTPASTKKDMEGIYTVQTNLTPNEILIRSRLVDLLRGDAASGRHAVDADHIFEAQKYGGRYFVTHDRRLLNHKNEIVEIIGARLEILTLREFMKACKDCGLV
jgi:hypothetical protein